MWREKAGHIFIFAAESVIAAAIVFSAPQLWILVFPLFALLAWSFVRDVKCNKAQRRLVSAETELSRVLDSVSDYLWSGDVDNEGSYHGRYFSPVVERIAGYPPEYFRPGSDRWFDLIHKEDISRVLDAVDRLKSRTSTCEEEEYRIFHRDGSVRWVRDSVTSLALEDGGVRLHGVVSDVSARKQAEEEVEQASRRLERILNSIVEGYYLLDADWRIAEANHLADEHFRDSEESVVGKNFWEVSRYQPGSEVYEKFHHCRAVRHPIRFETESRRKSGKWFELNLYPGVNSLEVFFRDITSRKKAEETLRENEERLKLITENLDDVFWIGNADFTSIYYVSRSFERLWGKSRESVYANPTVFLEPILPEDLPAILEQFRQWKHSDPCQLEYRIAAPDGTVRYVWDSVFPIRDETGNVKRLVGVAKDITERKRAEQELVKHKQQLRALTSELCVVGNRERRRLAAFVHDNVAQAVVLARMQLGFLRGSVQDQHRLTLDKVDALLQEVVQESRLLMSQLSPPVLHELGLVAAIESLLENFSEVHGLSCKFHSDGKPGGRNEDVDGLLYSVTRELLINVIKHANARSVTVGMQHNKEDIVIVVEDDGVGFDPSQVSESVDLASGFGLFSIRERLGYIGGDSEIRSEPGSGTRVTVRAPISMVKL